MPPTTPSPVSPPPPAPGLTVHVDLPQARLVLDGELDRTTCDQLAAASRVLAGVGPCTWVLDLAGLGFCDASGLRALAVTRRAAQDAGAAVLVVGARPFLRRLLGLAGLGDVLVPIAVTTVPGPGRPARIAPPAGTGRSARGGTGGRDRVAAGWSAARPA